MLSLVVYRRLSLDGADLDVEGSRDLVDFWIANSALSDSDSHPSAGRTWPEAVPGETET